ncbi:deoxyribodipyrimidine photolyase-like uncharacterized protein [Variovorax boronicumulans]|nr:deoxyribodipyrimidine photolyase-like uncharacterized protein [Variovorax boronicumulans]MDQ0001654.1 deoxyribodipyrimidine photolyase-like uncharacterized protein [Variovorax boronicumulans]
MRKPGTRSGEDDCPMTVMYWDFVARHARMLENNPRTTVMTHNLRRYGAPHSKCVSGRSCCRAHLEANWRFPSATPESCGVERQCRASK